MSAQPKDDTYRAEPNAERLRVLVVDDEEGVLYTLRRLLEAADHHVTTCLGGAEGVDAGRAGCFDLAIVDLMMPPPNGLEVLQALRDHQPACVRVLMSGRLDAEAMADALCAVSFAKVLPKPFFGYQITSLLANLPRNHAHPESPEAESAAERLPCCLEWEDSSYDEKTADLAARGRAHELERK